MRVLAGDIGGTKTLLQLAQFSGGDTRGRVICEQRYESHAYPGLLPMIREFLQAAVGEDTDFPSKACFGVAGPIKQTAEGQSVKVTNLPWDIDTASLAHATAIQKIRLINDFQAVGYGIESLTGDELAVLQEGRENSTAPRLVIGPGTGLGVGLLIRQGDHYEALPSEGGHIDFAPTDALQIELLHYLLQRFERVSCERVISGPGLEHIYEFLCAKAPDQPKLVRRQSTDDLAAAISELALKGEDALAREALALFIRLCGAYAGNLALLSLPYGGVYIAGGIAPKIIDAFKTGAFMQSFTAKGRMSALLQAIPVRVVLNPRVGLLGAAVAAARL